MFDPTPTAEMLLAARHPGEQLSAMPPSVAPSNEAEAYAVQNLLVHRLTQNLGPLVGYKIGCTNQSAREMLGVDSPFSGRVLARELHSSPAVLRSDELHMIGIEPEIAIRVAADMPGGRPWTADRVADVSDSIMPSVEIVESRFSTWPRMGILAAIADNGVHRKLILGESVTNWTQESIEKTNVSLTVNGKMVREGSARNVDGGPFSVLAWLANHLNQQGNQLQSGDVITTGVMTDIFDADVGQKLVADYGPLGTIEIETV
jgi:2-keto-4-pentenoate hydratase